MFSNIHYENIFSHFYKSTIFLHISCKFILCLPLHTENQKNLQVCVNSTMWSHDKVARIVMHNKRMTLQTIMVCSTHRKP